MQQSRSGWRGFGFRVWKIGRHRHVGERVAFLRGSCFCDVGSVRGKDTTVGVLKEKRAMAKTVCFFALLFGLLSGPAKAATLEELEAVPAFPAAPDITWPTPYLIDNFEYDDSPLNHGWGIFSPDSGAALATAYDSALGSRVLQMSGGLNGKFGIYFPKSGGGIGSANLNVWRSYLYFYLKTERLTFSLIVKIKNQNCAYKHIIYRLIGGNPYVSGDSVVIPLGAGLADGQWHEIIRNLSADLHKGFTGEALQTYFLAFKGDFSIDTLVLRNRPLIEGYANLTSVKQGNSIDFKVSLNRPGLHTFQIEFYREGATREFKFATPPIPGSEQPVAPLAYREGAGWPTSYTLYGSVTRDWRSGMYVAKLLSDQNDSSFIPFVIMEDNPGSTSNILVQFSTATYQAYNYWGGGSFYAGYDTVVSWDRPYSEIWYGPWSDASGAGQFYAFELPFVRWLEQQGYTAEYADNVSLKDPSFSLEKYRLFVSLGHDEYWYAPARDKLEFTFRDSLHNNLAFFSANSCFWRVREPDPNPQQKLITSKCSLIPCQRYADLWRGLVTDGVSNPRPEASLIGVMYLGPNVRGKPARVKKAEHWIFRGTGLRNGDEFGFGQGFPEGIGGYERDFVQSSSPPGTEVLAEAYSVDQCSGVGSNLAQTAYYKHSGGSEVFAAGGIQWSWGLFDADGKTAKVTKNVIDGLASTVRGEISQNSTWRGTVYLGGDVTIDSGVTLTIEPGTRILFFPDNDVERTGGDTTKTRIIVKGTLLSLGKPTDSSLVDSIIFSSASTFPAAGKWGGILVVNPGRANFNFCRFSCADTVISVRSDTASVKVRNCTFTHFKTTAIFTTSSRVNLGTLDCGRNNFLIKTAPFGAKAVINAAPLNQFGTQPFVAAKINWWGSVSPPSSWFVGNVHRLPALWGPATPDSCPTLRVVDSDVGSFELNQNFPNPFNPSTAIRYSISQAARVELKLYNILGQMVRKLVDRSDNPGVYQVVWDGKDESGKNLPSGIYFYQLRAGDYIRTRKMILMK